MTVGTALGAVVVDALRRSEPLPAWISATVSVQAPPSRFGLHIHQGRLALGVSEPARPDTTIITDEATLRGLVTGSESGVDAFLDGRLRVRGNLALSLRIAGMWNAQRPAGGSPRAADATALGLRTFYLDAGEGPVVILLHGLGATNASMLPTLQALAPRYRVVAPDLPGFGDSDKPLRPLHAGFYARWLLQFMDALGVERAHLVGNSMGGRVAIEAGLRHPQRIGRLGLLAPSPAFLRGREYVHLVRVLRPELALLPVPMPRWQVQRTLRGMFARPSRLADAWYDAAVDEFLRVFDSPRGRICFFSAARQIYLEEPHEGRGRFWGRLPGLAGPALFVWGARDRLVPVGFARHVEQALPAATSVILDDCGHVPQYERPDDTHGLLGAFLEEAA